ncbi:MAG: hypothetical protein PHU85_11535 [Phycisphaerae bacterium]|nr:hypothetical protein [Phycisphaerae bacterium]
MNPSEVAIAVADAVVATLNAGVSAAAFSTSFAAARSYETGVELENCAAVRVDVLFGFPAITRQDRASWSVRVPIDVAVRQQAMASNTSACDALAKLVGEIWDYLSNDGGKPREITVTDYDDVSFDEPAPDELDNFVPYDGRLLDKANLFVGVARVAYEVKAT